MVSRTSESFFKDFQVNPISRPPSPVAYTPTDSEISSSSSSSSASSSSTASNLYMSKDFIVHRGSWGLRGDPVLFEQLGKAMGQKEMPTTKDEYINILYRAFEEFTGDRLEADQQSSTRSFSSKIVGGRSGGGISHNFWIKKFSELAEKNYPTLPDQKSRSTDIATSNNLSVASENSNPGSSASQSSSRSSSQSSSSFASSLPAERFAKLRLTENRQS